jgi:hypothetical protein
MSVFKLVVDISTEAEDVSVETLVVFSGEKVSFVDASRRIEDNIGSIVYQAVPELIESIEPVYHDGEDEDEDEVNFELRIISITDVSQDTNVVVFGDDSDEEDCDEDEGDTWSDEDDGEPHEDVTDVGSEDEDVASFDTEVVESVEDSANTNSEPSNSISINIS